MAELKTLKDLKCVLDDEFSCCGGYKDVHYNPEKYGTRLTVCRAPWTNDKDLKQEAIKWIKELEVNTFDHLLDNCKIHDDFEDNGYDEYTSMRHGNVINWIMYFFNITEEDLK